MQISFALLRKFEGLRAVAYMAVASGAISGPTAALIVLRPNLFITLPLSKIFFLVIALGLPVLLSVSVAFLVSDAIGEPFDKVDLNKLAPGALVVASMLSMFLHLFALVMSKSDLSRYLWGVPIWGGISCAGVILAGALERYLKRRRERHRQLTDN